MGEISRHTSTLRSGLVLDKHMHETCSLGCPYSVFMASHIHPNDSTCWHASFSKLSCDKIWLVIYCCKRRPWICMWFLCACMMRPVCHLYLNRILNIIHYKGLHMNDISAPTFLEQCVPSCFLQIIYMHISSARLGKQMIFCTSSPADVVWYLASDRGSKCKHK